MTSGSTDLDAMLGSMDATVRPDEYVYATVAGNHPSRHRAEAVIQEDEGLTVILRREDAEAHGLDYHFVASWITLTVHSSLEAVGLTAAFSQALAAEGISCNVLAGFHHDHLLVPVRDTDRALAALRRLRKRPQA